MIPRNPGRNNEGAMKRLGTKVIIVIVLALVIYLGLVLFSAPLQAPNNGEGMKNQEFRGPVGDPYVKGPTSVPPGF